MNFVISLSETSDRTVSNLSGLGSELHNVTDRQAVLNAVSRNSVVELSSQGLSLTDISKIATENAQLLVTTEVFEKVAASRAVVDHAIASGHTAYGLNTLLGHRRNQIVDADQLAEYQRFVVSTHVAAVGPVFTDVEIRAILAARISGMAQGGSGISPQVFELLIAMLNRGVHPLIHQFGSVGAGDITPLSAVAEVVIGQGRARYLGVEYSGEEALLHAGLTPVALQAKDALTIISANAVSIGQGALLFQQLNHLAVLADNAGALTLEATDGNISPFTEPPLHRKSGEAGNVAARIKHKVAGSDVTQSGSSPGIQASQPKSVQDALSIRTIPQVHGAYRNQLNLLKAVLEQELNTASDNPFTDVENQVLISNGNFSAMDLALAIETVRLSLAHVGAISERRLHKLLDIRQHQVGLKLQIADEQLTTRGRIPDLIVNAAAGFLAQLKHAALPISLHSTSLNRDVEDHASHLPQVISATQQAVDLLELIVTIELLLAFDTVTFYGDKHVLSPQIHELCEAVDLAFNKQTSSSLNDTIELVKAAMREYLA